MYLFCLCCRKFPKVNNVPFANAEYVLSSLLFSIEHCSIFWKSQALKSHICPRGTGIQIRAACVCPGWRKGQASHPLFLEQALLETRLSAFVVPTGIQKVYRNSAFLSSACSLWLEARMYIKNRKFQLTSQQISKEHRVLKHRFVFARLKTGHVASDDFRIIQISVFQLVPVTLRISNNSVSLKNKLGGSLYNLCLNVFV